MRQISWYVSVNAKNKTTYGNIHNTKYTRPKKICWLWHICAEDVYGTLIMVCNGRLIIDRSQESLDNLIARKISPADEHSNTFFSIKFNSYLMNSLEVVKF